MESERAILPDPAHINKEIGQKISAASVIYLAFKIFEGRWVSYY